MNQNEGPSAQVTPAGLGEKMKHAITQKLSQAGDSVKRPSVPERPADILRRLAAKSRRWKW
jgi:hypothetical protein